MTFNAKKISPSDWIRGEKAHLRLVTLADCTERYEAWLADPEVNQYLETRWSPQPLSSIREFVASMLASEVNYLFAICEPSGRHVGNIKVGPIQTRHSHADVSYFLGEREVWGKGLGTEAVRLVTRFSFDTIGLHRTQAGLYESNIGSQRVLERAGYTYEGRFKKQLLLGASPNKDDWEDHLFYGAVNGSWA